MLPSPRLPLSLAVLAAACTTPADDADAGRDGGAPPARELYRPLYHFTPAAGWMNDPNGLVHADGTWHLFFQHDPDATVFGRVHWGHAQSEDLVRWSERPIALAPDETLGQPYSGSAVRARAGALGLCEGESCVVAAFTHHGGADGAEKQSLAVSDDGGATFALYPQNPVLPNDGRADFRDPRVFFHEPTGAWVMVLAAGPSLELFTSPDLVEWAAASSFTPPGGAGGVLECPELFELAVDGDPARTRWVLEYERNHVLEGGPPQPDAFYVLGDFDGRVFTADPGAERPVDHGPDFYAAQSWSDAPDGRRIWIAWMSHWAYALAVPTRAWRGAMTVPRELSLVDQGAGPALAQRPIPELAALERAPLVELVDVAVADEERALDGADGVALRVEASIAPMGARDVGIAVRVGDGERTRVGIADGALYLDRTESGRDSFADAFAARVSAPLTSTDVVDVTILVDASSVEVFADGGRAALTALVFPAAESVGVSLYASGAAAFPAVTVRPLAD